MEFFAILFMIWIIVEARAWHIRTLNRQRRKLGLEEKPYLSVIWYKDSIRF